MEKITIKEACDELDRALDNYGWYTGSEIDPSGRRITVFTEDMSGDASWAVPDHLYGYQITMAYTAYRDCAEKYGAIILDRGRVLGGRIL